MKSIFFLLAATSLIAGCGGGGGSKNHVASAQGQYTGTAAGLNWTTTIVPLGTIFMAYSYPENPDEIAGFIEAYGRDEKGTLFGSGGTDYNFGKPTARRLTVNGTYVLKRSLDSTLRYEGAESLHISQIFNPKYVQAPNLQAFSGEYKGTMDVRDGVTESLAGDDDASFRIDANGNITGDAEQCKFSGTVSPLSDGKGLNPAANAYDVRVAIAEASDCPFSNVNFKGIIVPRTETPNTIDLMMTSSRGHAVLFSGKK